MRLCRCEFNRSVEVALYEDDRVIRINGAAEALGIRVPTAGSSNVLDYLAPHGKSAKAVQRIADRFAELSAAQQRRWSRSAAEVRLRVPIPEPRKVILLAGNYAAQANGLSSEKLIEMLFEAVPADKKYEKPAA